MKRIFKFIILLVVFCLPVMVGAKVNTEYVGSYLNMSFVGIKDDLYYFYDSRKEIYEEGYILIYDKDGELIKEDNLVENYDYTDFDIVNSDYFKMFPNIFLYSNSVFYNNKIYHIDYHFSKIYYYDFDIEEFVYYSFADDESFTRKVLGEKYEVFLKIKDEDIIIGNINQLDSLFVVSYRDENYNYGEIVLDEEFNVTANFDHYMNHVFYSFDNLLYVLQREYGEHISPIIDLYNIKGDKVYSVSLDEEELISNEGGCYFFYPEMMQIYEDKLYITFESNGICDSRIEMNDISEIGKIQERITNLTLIYKLNYEIESIKSNNGDFTYEKLEDEAGKNYVELKISPNEGYIIDEIIVTDLNGNRIEVTDNKFFMPMSDVKVEIKYKEIAEYVPVPDTFLGRSITLIFIGLILIGLGVYTVNYVKN